MTKEKAINFLASGHSFWYISHAEKICKVLGLKLPKNLIDHYSGQAEANPTGHPKGLWLEKDEPCSGVNSLSLSDWVVRQLNLEVQGYIGRGFQAQANSEALVKHFKIKS